MTSLATHDLEPNLLDTLALVADDWTPLGILAAERFRDACWAVAMANAGDVDPSKVRARLLNKNGELDIEPRKYSSLWSTACSRDGYLDKTDVLVEITGEGSRGNTNKSVFMRRWRGWSA